MGRPPRERESGIYALILEPTGHAYIGSAVDLFMRYRVHMNTLRNGKNHNKVLQFAYDVFGEDSFKFKVLEKLPKDKLQEREFEILKNWDGPLFNLLKDARTPPREFSAEERKKLSEKAKKQHREGTLRRKNYDSDYRKRVSRYEH